MSSSNHSIKNKKQVLDESAFDILTESSDYDYKTQSISDEDIRVGDIFDTTTLGGFSYISGSIPGSKDYQYMIDSKNKKGEIVQMSPNEYYEICAKRFNSTVDNLKNSRSFDKDYIEELTKVITDKRKKFPMPFIDFTDATAQEGLHRMYVAGSLYGWDKKFPVLVVDWADIERKEREEKEAHDSELEYDIRLALDNALESEYDNLEEFEEELKYYLKKQIYGAFSDEEIDFNIKYNVDTFTVTVDDVSVSDNIDEIQLYIDEDDFGIEDLEEKIIKKDSKWEVKSEKGKSMGTYNTKKEAEKRLKDIEMFKHMKESNLSENYRSSKMILDETLFEDSEFKELPETGKDRINEAGVHQEELAQKEFDRLNRTLSDLKEEVDEELDRDYPNTKLVDKLNSRILNLELVISDLKKDFGYAIEESVSKDDKDNHFFKVGDRVRYARNLHWTDGADKDIGRVGTVELVTHLELKLNNPKSSRVLVVKADDKTTSSGFLAYDDELEPIEDELDKVNESVDIKEAIKPTKSREEVVADYYLKYIGTYDDTYLGTAKTKEELIKELSNPKYIKQFIDDFKNDTSREGMIFLRMLKDLLKENKRKSVKESVESDKEVIYRDFKIVPFNTSEIRVGDKVYEGSNSYILIKDDSHVSDELMSKLIKTAGVKNDTIENTKKIVDTMYDAIDGKISLEESVNEDWENAIVIDLAKPETSEEPPKTGEDMGASELLIQAINDEWEAVSKYNSIIATLSNNPNFDGILDIVRDIVAEENVHIGQLQRALETISPNASKISEGDYEAAEQLKDSSDIY